jgi:hypothetical protein
VAQDRAAGRAGCARPRVATGGTGGERRDPEGTADAGTDVLQGTDAWQGGQTGRSRHAHPVTFVALRVLLVTLRCVNVLPRRTCPGDHDPGHHHLERWGGRRLRAPARALPAAAPSVSPQVVDILVDSRPLREAGYGPGPRDRGCSRPTRRPFAPVCDRRSSCPHDPHRRRGDA